MKILMLTDSLGVGGVETHVETLCVSLKKLGCDPIVASGGGRGVYRLWANGISHFSLPDISRTYRLPTASLKISRLISAEHPDILHAHTRRSAFAAALPCRAHGIPLVVTAHAFFSMRFPLAALSVWGNRTIAVSDDICHLLRSHGVKKENLSVVPNGIEFSANKIADRKGSHKIAFVSRLDADCSLGAELLCDAAPRLFRSFSDLEIIIVGGGSEAERISRRAEEINVLLGRSIIRTVGERAEPREILCDCSLFVGVSRSAIEAMSLGVPVILLGNEGYLGLLEPDRLASALRTNLTCRGHGEECTADRLASEAERYFSLPNKQRSALSDFSFAAVRKHFGAEQMACKTLEIYKRAISEHHGGKKDE